MAVKFNEKSCGIVLFSKENGENVYLLLHYPGGHWDFVKGHIEEGEDETTTAMRELQEETGIESAEFTPDFREQISYYYKREGQLSHKEVVFFLAETKEKEVRISHEHKGYKWLPYEAAVKGLTFENAKKLLEKAKNILDSKK